MSNTIYGFNDYSVESSNPSTPSSNRSRLYLKFEPSEINLFLIDDTGTVKQASLPKGNNSNTIRHNGSNWIITEDLKITTTEVVINDNGLSTMDFRVESDTLTHILFVDSSDDVIGINNNAPSNVNIMDVGGTKPVRLNRMTTGQINLMTKQTGQIYYNSSINKLYYSGGSTPATRTIDNLYGHPGYGYKYVNTNTNLTLADFYVLVDANLGNVTVFLPTTGLANGVMFHIKAWTPSIYAVTIDGGSISIETFGTTVALSGYKAYILIYDTTLGRWMVSVNG